MIKLADHFLELLYLAKTNTLYIGSPLTIVVLPFGIEKKIIVYCSKQPSNLVII